MNAGDMKRETELRKINENHDDRGRSAAGNAANEARGAAKDASQGKRVFEQALTATNFATGIGPRGHPVVEKGIKSLQHGMKASRSGDHKGAERHFNEAAATFEAHAKG